MKKIIFPFVLVAMCITASLITLAACAGNRDSCSDDSFSSAGKRLTKTYDIGNFSKLESDGCDVNVTIGKATGILKVTASEGLMEHLIVEVDGETLELGFDSKFDHKRPKERPRVEITVPSLRSIEATLSARVKVDAPFTVDKLNLDITTSANVSLQDVTVKGKCTIDATTAGKFSAGTLTAGKVDVDITTSASAAIDILTAEQIDVDCSTAGSFSASSGTVNKASLDANTAASISMAGVTAHTGNAEANTAGKIRSNIANPSSISKNTGGHIKNSSK